MNFWPPASHFLYCEHVIPKFSSQPQEVFFTPGLGHIVQDYQLYIPLNSYVEDVKEVEKDVQPPINGGFDLNPPLLGNLPVSGKKRTSSSRKARISSPQKGQGRDNIEATAIETALHHPIKVL